MISDAIKEKGFDIDKRKVEIAEPIKALGIYEINVKLHHSVIAVVKTWIVREPTIYRSFSCFTVS